MLEAPTLCVKKSFPGVNELGGGKGLEPQPSTRPRCLSKHILQKRARAAGTSYKFLQILMLVAWYWVASLRKSLRTCSSPKATNMGAVYVVTSGSPPVAICRARIIQQPHLDSILARIYVGSMDDAAGLPPEPSSNRSLAVMSIRPAVFT